MFDVAVIGGGAAGLCAAVCLKQQNNALNVVVLEALDRVGKKLITTGNGRCNITNSNLNNCYYHSQTPNLIDMENNKYGLKPTMEFFEKIGVEIVFEQNGKAYPASYQASSVVDALRFSAEENGVEIICNCCVTDFKFSNQEYTLITENSSIKAKNVIFATGLYSGGAKLGSTGQALKLLKTKGYKTEKTTPAIVQLKTENTITKQLKGIKIDAVASIYLNNKKINTNFGEVLFTEYGLSGPAIMALSREVERNNGEFKVLLDCAPNFTEQQLKEMLLQRVKNLKNRPTQDFLTGFLNKRLGQVILKLANIPLNIPVNELDLNSIQKLCYLIKNLEFKVLSTTGFVNSQVTAGGISLTEVDLQTMCSKKHKGLYIIGELLDIDGDCGGYNLQWCWTSAFMAANSILKGI